MPFTVSPYYGHIDDLTFVILMTIIVHLVYLLAARVPKLRNLTLFVLVIFVHILVVAEWWHYEFFRDYIHFNSIAYAGSWKELGKGISGFEGRYWAIVFIIISGGFFYACNRYWHKQTPGIVGLSLATLFFTLLSAGLFWLTTYVYLEVNIRKWQMNRPIPLAHKNPLLEIVRERFLAHEGSISVSNEHAKALSSFYGADKYKTGNQAQPIELSSGFQAKANNKNVILIVLESFRLLETGKQEGYSLTPNFDRIASQTFSPKYFYANSNQTVKAEIATMCGLHDFVIGASLSVYSNRLHLQCLPQLLSKSGYRTLWFHGAAVDFYNRDLFLPKMGFKEIHGKRVIEEALGPNNQKKTQRHWGVEDPYVFKYALKELEKIDTPFFAEILSVSNHHPFVDIEKKWDLENFPEEIQGDMDNVYRRYQHSIYYVDRALGEFWDEFEQSKLYNNTAVVIVGDHGIWLFPGVQYLPKSPGRTYESYLRLPMAMYLPGQTFTQEVATPLSQVDIATLISMYLFDDVPASFQSKLDPSATRNLLSGEALQSEFKNPVFASIGDGYFLRQGEHRCFPPLSRKDNCDDYLFRCVEKHNTLVTNKHCQSWQGDILREPVEVQESDLDTTEADMVVDYFRKIPFH